FSRSGLPGGLSAGQWRRATRVLNPRNREQAAAELVLEAWNRPAAGGKRGAQVFRSEGAATVRRGGDGLAGAAGVELRIRGAQRGSAADGQLGVNHAHRRGPYRRPR